ncbi:uncharacterized protein [Antedon mediterranea]|uniref:uncharacterized protein n=1 Tax=Antedon mediterranea TaxID=105859 RepID=UPI003AF908F2
MDSELEKRPHSTPKHSADKKYASNDETYSYSFNSTGDSTRSLLSVLSHSSVESLSEHDISDDDDKKEDNNEDSQFSKKSDSKNQASTSADIEEELDSKLNVFEKWLVKKIKEERKAIKTELKKEEEAKRVKEEEENRNRERQSMIQHRIQAWVTEHKAQDMYRKKINKREEQRKQEIKEEEKVRTKEREKACREEWLEKKRQEKKLKVVKEKEEREKKIKEENEKKEKAKEKYDEWYRNSIQKPRKVKNSYAYSEGTLKGYYDSGAYPLPSYCNPIPWKPIHVPQNTEDVSATKGRRRTKKKMLQDPSPPLLFKSRTAKENIAAFGRPR